MAVRRVVLATDLAAGSASPFAHALAFVIHAGAELYLVHIEDPDDPGQPNWRGLPPVRTMLERWHRIPKDAPAEEIDKIGVRVHPISVPAVDDVPTAIARRTLELQPDLLILGTHARTGFDRLFTPSLAEPVARDVHRATLFVPEQARGLVEAEQGALRVRKVLVPITSTLAQQPLIDELVDLLDTIGAKPVSFTFVHVGDEGLPTLSLPPRSDWMWKTDRRQGGVVEQILEAAVEHEADLIAMATSGHQSLWDAIRGSTTERVVRRAPCPVLAVPV